MQVPEFFSELSFVAIQTALNAGSLLRSGFETKFEINTKSGQQNLVTEFDQASEKQIITTLKEHFPSHAIVAEESGGNHRTEGVTWVIDPLDGTVNFAHGIPLFSVSIAAVVDEVVVTGVVYQPMTQELFIAEKGKGAFLNGRPLAVSQVDQFDSALMATGFPYYLDEQMETCVEKFTAMQKKGFPIRRLGSAAIDLAYVAAGRFDTFWEVGLHSWDVAAGKLLVEEAGGQVTHWNGDSHRIFGYHSLLATNGKLHQKMVKHLE